MAADVLDALARKLDGSPVSPSYFSRRRRAGAGAQVRQRHRLPLLPPGLGKAGVGRLSRFAAAEQAFVKLQDDEAGDHADDWYQHQVLPMKRA